MRYLMTVWLIFVLLSSASAHELDAQLSNLSRADSNHSVSGLLIPTLAFNSLQLGYEYKVAPRVGIRADGLLILSLGGSMLLGSLSSSVLIAEAATSTARHGIELDLGAATFAHTVQDCPNEVCETDWKTRNALRGFIGYRYQKNTGFQLRIGAAPLVMAANEIVVLPEMTLGVSF